MDIKKGRIFYFDFIRVLAIFLVILIHVTGIDLGLHVGSTQWTITKYLNYFAHASVPMFFMISGALLLNSPKTESLGYTWKKRIPHVVIPFILWSLLSTFFIAVYAHTFSLPNALKMYSVFLYQPVSPTLWFMYPLIGLYVLSPFLRTLVKGADNKMLFYLTSIWLITNSLMPTLSAFLSKDYAHALDFYPGAGFTLMGGYIGYFFLGYLISQMNVEKVNGWLLAVIALLAMYFGDLYSSKFPKTNDPWNNFYVTSIFIVIMAIATYILLQKWGLKIKARPVKKAFSWLSPLVFGIYLVHNILILFLEPWFMKNLPYTGLLATFTRYFAIAILATLIIWILHLIPGVNYLLTGSTRKRK